MATATAVGGPDRVETAASSAAAVLAVAVASQRLLGLLALAVSVLVCVIAVQFEYLMNWIGTHSHRDNHVILLPLRIGLSTNCPVIALLIELTFMRLASFALYLFFSLF
jgi:hypothetical protein